MPVFIGLGTLALMAIAVTRGQLGYENYREEEADVATRAETLNAQRSTSNAQ